MVFSSLIFIFFFLPAVLLIYYISPRCMRNFILLISSLVFYAWGEPVYIFLMIFSIVFNYIAGRIIYKFRNFKSKSMIIFTLTIIINLGILCFFKYYGFILTNLGMLLNVRFTQPKLSLPVGISFYTFQTMSYIIDVYKGIVPAQKNIISFGTYIAMFPQLIAGPIVRYEDIEDQLSLRKETFEMFCEGSERFIIGLAKKVLLANNIALLWNTVKNTPFNELTVLSSWLGIIAFTFQIYFDFSGYSDMAVGLGKMFGFDLMENFNYPYISKSATEFWRRWHISLGSWFKEYVYIPLGGNRKGIKRMYLNLLIVWFLTGFWHGADWNFILWGLYYAFFLILEKTFLIKWFKNKPPFIAHLYALLVIIIGWVFFEFTNINTAFSFIGIMFGFGNHILFDKLTIYLLYTNAILLAFLSIGSTPVLKNAVKSFTGRLKNIVWKASPAYYLILLILCTAYIVNESYNPFLYFRF